MAENDVVNDLKFLDELRVEPGKQSRLHDRSPADRLGLGRKADGPSTSDQLLVVLDALHNRLWAEAKRSVVLVLQGMDAAGKDGTIRRVLTGLNPQGVTSSTSRCRRISSSPTTISGGSTPSCRLGESSAS